MVVVAVVGAAMVAVEAMVADTELLPFLLHHGVELHLLRLHQTVGALEPVLPLPLPRLHMALVLVLVLAQVRVWALATVIRMSTARHDAPLAVARAAVIGTNVAGHAAAAGVENVAGRGHVIARTGTAVIARPDLLVVRLSSPKWELSAQRTVPVLALSCLHARDRYR